MVLVVGEDPTERDPTSGDLPERDLTTKACVSTVTAGRQVLGWAQADNSLDGMVAVEWMHAACNATAGG